MSVLSSPEKNIPTFFHEDLISVHKIPVQKIAIFPQFGHIFAYLNKIARARYARETISSTFFKQNLCYGVISSKSEYKISKRVGEMHFALETNVT